MKIIQEILIPYINDDVFYYYLIDFIYKNGFKLLSIYHNSSSLTDCVVLEVYKESDPIIFTDKVLL